MNLGLGREEVCASSRIFVSVDTSVFLVWGIKSVYACKKISLLLFAREIEIESFMSGTMTMGSIRFYLKNFQLKTVNII
jgi:hypothetical protein